MNAATPTAHDGAPASVGMLLWFTGLSGAGKSTLAQATAQALRAQGLQPLVLDGDAMRRGLCADLGFTPKDRQENMRRVGEVAKLLLDTGTLVLGAFISPLAQDRARVAQIVGPERFVEIHAQCPLSVCEARDPRGLYQRARANQIAHFTGISAPYEDPTHAALVLDTSGLAVDACVTRVLALLQTRMPSRGV